MRILLPNVTSPRNIGDLAMLEVLLDLIRQVHPKADIILHISEPELYSPQPGVTVKTNVYSWMMFPRADVFSRFRRMVYCIWLYVAKRYGWAYSGKADLVELLEDYETADLIVFSGGGYLRSQKGVRQSASLLSLAVVYLYASLSRARTVMMPISFGPFAYRWQARLFGRLLSRVDVVFAREQVSFDALCAAGVAGVRLSTDMALLSAVTNNTSGAPRNAIGFTLLQWFDKAAQQALEDTVTEALLQVHAKTNATFQPIVQVHAPTFGVHDQEVVERVGQRLLSQGCKVLPTRVVANVADGREVYGSLAVLLGMRMHSGILAYLSGVPVVGLAYEHKALGIARTLEVERFYFESSQVTIPALVQALLSAYTERDALIEHINSQLTVLRARELPILKEALA